MLILCEDDTYFFFNINFVYFSFLFVTLFLLPWFILFYLLVIWETSVIKCFLLLFVFLFNFWNYFDFERDFDCWVFSYLNEEMFIDFLLFWWFLIFLRDLLVEHTAYFCYLFTWAGLSFCYFRALRTFL